MEIKSNRNFNGKNIMRLTQSEIRNRAIQSDMSGRMKTAKGRGAYFLERVFNDCGINRRSVASFEKVEYLFALYEKLTSLFVPANPQRLK